MASVILKIIEFELKYFVAVKMPPDLGKTQNRQSEFEQLEKCGKLLILLWAH